MFTCIEKREPIGVLNNIKNTHGGVYAMNMKNMIRKVAAVGAGATMVGATLMGALASSLADYPAPFVSDGAFDAVLIVGDNAAAADIIGVTDIAMALQFSMKTTENVQIEGDLSVCLCVLIEIIICGNC